MENKTAAMRNVSPIKSPLQDIMVGGLQLPDDDEDEDEEDAAGGGDSSEGVSIWGIQNLTKQAVL